MPPEPQDSPGISDKAHEEPGARKAGGQSREVGGDWRAGPAMPLASPLSSLGLVLRAALKGGGGWAG